MDNGRYVDFNGETPNEIWAFVEKDDGGFRFEPYHLNHARLGDSDSLYCSLPPRLTEEKSIDQIVEIADSVISFVNSSYPSLVKHAFNCPDDRTHHIESNREIVADAVFVASKKRYAARVIDDEGERCNKLKVLGLEVKRSDTPSIVQEYLTDLINMILDDKSADEIKEEIVKMKDNYSKVDLKDIARPMSCKGLKIYQDKFEKTGSNKGFPYQVRAAMFYNSLCGPSDKKINAGEKIGILYIKDSRSKYIAFPSESNTLPGFVYDMVIDYDTQWQKAEKKIISYLKAMGYDFDSQKAAVREELFGF